jgi:hypothetical protein
MNKITFLVINFILAGCSYSIEIMPPGPEIFPQSLSSTSAVAVLSSISLEHVTESSQANLSQNSEPWHRQDTKFRLRDSQLFKKVIDEEKEEEKVVRLHLKIVKEYSPPHSGSIMGGAFLTVFTIGLLAPVLYYDFEYKETVFLDVERWDGQRKRYEASANGSTSGTANYLSYMPDLLVKETHQRAFNLLIEVVLRIRTGCYATICDQRRVIDYESNPHESSCQF